MQLSNRICRTAIFRGVASITFAFLILGRSTEISAQTAWSDGTGNWFTAGNWTNGVPNFLSATSFDARIDNGGTAQISSGGSVRRLTLGSNAGQVGSLLIDSGSLTVTENLHLGESGQGTVTLRNGGAILSDFTRLGRFSGGTGTATVSGNSTFWSATSDFLVGETGSGSLTINQGADVVVSNNFLVADSLAPQSSTVVVSGAGSNLSVSTGLLRIGNSGNASMLADSGATISSQDVVIANGLTSTAVTTISGAGTTWTMAKLSRIGVSGAGSMNVSSGAKVSATDTTTATSLILGDFSDGVGTLFVTGAGSTFTSAREVDVGRLGTGALTLTDGGLLSINNGASPLRLGLIAVSKGTLNIGNGGAPGILQASAIQFGAGTGTINFNHTGTLAFSTPILGNGTVQKLGAGTSTFTAPSTFTGSLDVIGGTVELRGAGSFSNLLPVSIETSGTLSLFDATTTRAQAVTNNGHLIYADSALAGTANITNNPTPTLNYLSGSTRFLGHSSAQNATINNLAATPSVFGGETLFADHANAGSAIITNSDSTGSSNAFAGSTVFVGDSSAASASITNRARTNISGISGFTQFADASTAANAQITNEGSAFATGFTGFTIFAGKTAGNATFNNQGGKVSNGAGGITYFNGGDGGTAHFINGAGAVAGALGGVLNFDGQSGPVNAGHATVNNNGASLAGARGGSTVFSATASAGFANITAGGAGNSATGTTAGSVRFNDQTSAGSATFDLQAGSVAGAPSGLVEFGGFSSAESAKFTVAGAPAANFLPATLSFKDSATAANAAITAKGGGPNSTPLATYGARVKFAGAANAGAAVFTVEAGTTAGGAGATIEFDDATSAGSATFTMLSPTVAGNLTGGDVAFYGSSSASSATFNIQGSQNQNTYTTATGSLHFFEQSNAGVATLTTLPSNSPQSIGGSVLFEDSASAGAATIKSKGAAVPGALGGQTLFLFNSSGANANIFAEGGLVTGALGSDVEFFDQSSAGSATIRIGAGVPGAGGSTIRFNNTSSGGQAAFTVEAGAIFDISALTSTGTTAGSIAGAGNFKLGAKSLITGGLNTSTTVSGTITGEFGNLIKVGTGTLSLTGVNTFSGKLDVRAGKVLISQPFTTSSAVNTSNTGIVQLAVTANGQNTLNTFTLSATGTSRIDLTNNKLITATAVGDWDGAAYTGVTGLIQTGYHNGAWDGPGLITSIATSATTLGVARADDIGMTGKTFGGVAAIASNTLVRYTLSGDADLDGKVGFTDLVRLAQNYGKSGAGWSRGDFNYNGTVDFADLVKLAQNYGANPIPSDIPMASPEFANDYAAAFADAVPEPSVFAWMIASAAIFMSRRRLRVH